jgi:Heparinase II/III-like protein/Heparinase II/III N-terminus
VRVGELIARARVRGLRETARGAARLARREVEGAVRRRRLARRPLALAAGDLERALGRDPVELLRTRVLVALPSVLEFERNAGESVLARAADVLSHRFDLLGSGPVRLDPIDWQLDVKSGRRWPLVHISRVPVSYPDGSDIKWPWELSRCQHLPLLAAAWRETKDRRYIDELGAQLDSWIDGNPVEFGANWLIAMEPAIRAVNWIAALALVAEDAEQEPWFRRALESLVLHGRFIRSHLEGGSVRGNHYLSNIVGLLALGALFAGPEGTRWLQHGARSLAAELEHQVLPDGVDHEVSTAYHRFVTELFACGLEVVEALAPEELPPRHRERIEQMRRFTTDVARPDGLVPLVGDSDDGRLLPLAGYGEDPRAVRSSQTPAITAAYRDAGFYVQRRGAAYLLVRCGPTGAAGQGWHAHNDQLSFELALGESPLVVDPGSYVYTASPTERNRFRSTSFHSTVSVDGAEQNDLSPFELFRLVDRTGAKCTVWEPPVFEGTHSGFRSLGGVIHTRRLQLGDHELAIDDTIEGAAGKVLEWTFPLAGGAAAVTADGVEATVGDVEFHFGGLLDWRVEQGWYAPRYGVRVAVPFVRARKTAAAAEDTTSLRISF